MSVLETIVKVKFLADEKQVEALAGIVGEGLNASGTYLSVVLAHVQAAVSGRRKSKDAQLAAIDDVHKRFYDCVLRGVGPAEMEQPERNRRATFARSAVSDLRHYVKAGGDVRSLDAATVSKAKLRAEGKEVPTGTRTERSLKRADAIWDRAILRLARRDVEAARKEIIERQAALDAILEQIGRPPEVTRKPAKRAHRGRHVPRGEAARTAH